MALLSRWPWLKAKCCNILHTAEISCLPTTISFVQSKMLYKAIDDLSGKAVLETVYKWLQDQPKIFFLDRIHKLDDHWNKCIKKNGD